MVKSSTFLLVILSVLPTFLLAHGYLSFPPPRGIEKEAYAVDDLKSPNRKGVCRGEPAGKVTPVKPGGTLTLGLTITAPHTGPCELYLLSYPDLRQEKKITEKYDCAAPGKVKPWTVTLPTGISGRKVLRWYWEGRHISTPGEPYEQCIDVDFGGYGDSKSEPDTKVTAKDYKPKDEREPEHSKDEREPKHPKDEPEHPKTEDKPEHPMDKGNASVEKPKKSSKKHGSKRHGKKKAKKNPKRKHDDSPNYGSDNGSCKDGNQRCSNKSEYQICDHGKWVDMKCSTYTSCKQNGDYIACA